MKMALSSIARFLLISTLCSVAYASGASMDGTSNPELGKEVEPLLGPLGNRAVPTENISLTGEEKTQINAGKYRAALVWHGAGNWVSALSEGAKATFGELGIKVVAETDAQFDPAKQASDVENVMALKPDVILTLSLDSVSGKTAFTQAVDAGTKIVLLSNPINDFEHGKDYVSIVSDDVKGMGRAAAELMKDAVGADAPIGMIFHDVAYYVTNSRDQAFRSTLLQNVNGYPRIISEKGFIKESETSNVALAMVMQQPEIKGIYVSWDAAAEGVVEALRSIGRRDIKVITHDLGVNNLLDMARGGSIYGVVSDRPFEIGAAMARLGAHALLGKKTPAFAVVPYEKVTQANMAEVWAQAFRKDLPPVLRKLLGTNQQ